MKQTFESKTFSIQIAADPKTVYAFTSDPENLPKWATAFCKSIKYVDSDWIMETNLGPAKVKFAEKNAFGILDHYVNPNPDVEVYVPMRVVPNQYGSELIFTLFKLPFMDESKFKEDIELVERDLDTLK